MLLSQCKRKVTDVVRVAFMTLDVIRYLPFDDHYKVVGELLKIVEDRCDEVIEEVKKVYGEQLDEDPAAYEMEKKMVVGVLKIVKLQVSHQKTDIDRPIAVKINEKALWEMINTMMTPY